jgi:NitT/TauT family transport system substrate-binding protein
MKVWFECLFLALLSGEAFAVTELKLVLNWKPEAEFGGFYAAQLGKGFEREGLRVSILPGGVGTPAVQMVASGQAEFGISSADEVVLAAARGADVVGLYAVYQTNPHGFLFSESKAWTSLSQALDQGILAVQKGLPYFLFLEHKYGKPKAKVVPYLGGIAQIAENPELTQQCFVTSEPILAKKKGLKVKTLLVAESGFNPYTTLVVVKREFATKHKEVVHAFRRAIDAGWKEYLKHPEAANREMHKLNPSMDLETLAASAEIQKPLIETAETKTKGLGTMSEARWAELAEQLKAIGLVKTVKPAKDYLWN